MKPSIVARLLFPLLLVTFLLLPAPVANALTITVNNTNDSGPGSLRQAILDANGNVDASNVINITATGNITLASSLPNLTKALTINGPGATSLTVSGTHTLHDFVVDGVGPFVLQDMTIADGTAQFGGGIRISSAANGVTVNNDVFSGNVSAGGGGGAIYNGGSHLTVTNSVFVNNQGYGGGINNDGSGVLVVTNTTFSGNGTNGLIGGDIAQIGTGGSTTLNNVTISTSNAQSAIFVAQGMLTARNTIVANSTGSSCQTIAGAALVDGGYNIDSGATCGFAVVNHSMNNTNANLGPLADNGGPTQTMAIALGSSALDKIPSAGGCGVGITTDQRGAGHARPSPSAGLCDIGAYELQQFPNQYLPLIMGQ